MILQLAGGTSGAIIDTAARIVGTAIFAGFLAGAVALLYRWYVREQVPAGLALLVGLAGVAVVAGTTTLLAEEIAPGGDDLGALAALANVVTFLVGGAGAYGGIRVGDALGVDLFAATGGDGIDGDLSEFVRAVGRVVAVEIPDDIHDIVGYDPVPMATTESLAGRTFLFPRRLTQSELRERFVARLKTDYGVGHVDVELDESGEIEYLALGSRAAGIGPTLPPATNAVAIRADPANAASAGDLVQVWETNPMRRVLTGELRGVAGEIVTVAIDAADTPKLDPTAQYKLVTLPVQDRPDREFASLLRASDETLATITVQTGSRVDGLAVDSVGVTVAAITRDDEQPTALPQRDRTVRGGDVLYSIATPDALRKLEAACEAPEDVVVVDEPDDPDTMAAERSADGDQEQSEAAESDDTAQSGAEAERPDNGTDDSDEPTEVPSGGAFPDGDEGEIPDSAAFPDTDDLAGADVSTATSADEHSEDSPLEDGFDGGEHEDASDEDGSGEDTAATDSSDGTEDASGEKADEDDAPDFGDLLEESESSDDGLDELLADESDDEDDPDPDG